MLTGSFWSTQRLTWGVNEEKKAEVVAYQIQQTIYVIKEYFIGNALCIKQLLDSPNSLGT